MQHAISILVIGKSGSGKSTVINSLFRRPVARVSRGVCATDHEIVERHQTEIGGVNVTLADTRGLGDPDVKADEIISRLIKNSEFDLVLICIKLTERLDSVTLDGIRDISKAYGENFWKRSIILATFANHFQSILEEECPNDVVIRELSSEVDKVYKKLQEKMSHIPKQLLSEVPHCPTGKISMHDAAREIGETLCTSNNWPHDVFQLCLNRCSTQSKTPMLTMIESIPFYKSKMFTTGVGGGVGGGIGIALGGVIGTVFFPGIGTAIGLSAGAITSGAVGGVVGGVVCGMAGGMAGLKLGHSSSSNSKCEPAKNKKED